MNNIKQLQNDPLSLKYLAAQRVLYKKAKDAFGLQILFTVAISVILSFIKIFSKETVGVDLNAYVGLASITISSVDIIYFNTRVSKLRTNGAKIQELFDCNLFGLPWNSANSGAKPENDIIEENANQYENDSDVPLENWYDIELDHLPKERAILLCQETNLFYDGKLRDHFKNANIGVCAIVFLISFVVALFTEMKVSSLIVNVLVPILPILTLTMKIVMENNKSLKSSTELKKTVSQLKAADGNPTMTDLRQVQDKIFCSRKDSSLVPEWFYKWRRRSLEKAMQANARA